MRCSKYTCCRQEAQASDSGGGQSSPSNRSPVSQDRSPSKRSSESGRAPPVLLSKAPAPDARLPDSSVHALGSNSKAATKAGCACRCKRCTLREGRGPSRVSKAPALLPLSSYIYHGVELRQSMREARATSACKGELQTHSWAFGPWTILVDDASQKLPCSSDKRLHFLGCAVEDVESDRE